MSLTLHNEAKTAPTRRGRLLHGLSPARRTRAADAPRPLGRTAACEERRLVDELEAAGLVGHGGAWFPVSTKWRSVAGASRRRPVVVANGAESEPASRKDALLLTHAPHLVLDGLALAADALRAQQAIVYAPARESRSSRPLSPSVTLAASTRSPSRSRRRPTPSSPARSRPSSTRSTGAEGAVPSFVGVDAHPRARRRRAGRPWSRTWRPSRTSRSIARFGATWFREVGTPENPGTMLLTVNATMAR